VSDGASWLDSPSTRADLPVLAAYATPSNPLLLDEGYRPKDAYRAVADALSRVATTRGP
jgi:GH35 family endo-1,4-beta-xylanase